MATEAARDDDVVTGGKKRSFNQFMPEFTVRDSVLKMWRLERIQKQERKALVKRYMDEFMDEHKKTLPEASSDETMEPQAGGAGDEIWEPQADESLEKISASHLRLGVVSVALFSGKLMVYACSGVAVRHWHGNIRDCHTIFVTSARLARKFNDNRTRDDNLRIEMHTHDNVTMHGFLGVYDENIAMVTSLSYHPLYAMDTCNLMDLPQGTRTNKLFAFGRATNGTLMGAKCSHPISSDEGLVSVNCKITETGLGGPVMYFGRCGSERIAGLITGYCKENTTFLPTKMLHEWLQRLLLITSKTFHFRGYSLPHGVKTIIPSGFAVKSKVHQYLGYPLPPPLVFEFNGRLIGMFEESFGQYHHWDEYRGEKLIWKQFGKYVAKKISQSVVSIASFYGAGERKIRYFACTGLLIEGKGCTHILTSASLVRNAKGQIDTSLSIEVFLPPDECANVILELYHENYNIAVFRLSLSSGLKTISPQDIFTGRKSRNNKSVVAIGRAPKVANGLLMASMGKVKGKYNAVTKDKNKHLTGPHHGLDLDCEDLLLSTCQIKKVGIGRPLMSLDGSFIGMNFYDESRTTPFLPKTKILKVLHKGFALLEGGSVSGPVNMEDHLITEKRRRNKWPVSEPYWCLGGQGDVLEQISAKFRR